MSEYPYVDKAIEYAQDILDDKIPAGYWVQLSCQRFLNDLVRCEEDEDWPYTFDPIKASRVCKFIELLPHTKGKWAQESQKLKLEAWQCFIKVNEFGFIRKDNGKRRFLESQVLVPRKNGKALSLDTLIPTPSGWTTMGAIKEGDQVFGPDGSIRNVIFATDPMLNHPCYKVTMCDGHSVIADAEHLWETDSKKDRENKANKGKNRGPKPSIKTTQEIADTLWCRNELNHIIRAIKPIQLPEADLLIHPYALGAWLGDGGRNGSGITIGDADADDMTRLLGETGHPVRHRGDISYTFSLGHKFTSKVNFEQSFTYKLRQIGVYQNKHVPIEYLRGSIDQRLAMLQGLMDTDGYVSKAGQCVFTNTNRRLVDAVEELVWSLGYKPRVTEFMAKIDGREISPAWSVQFFAWKDLPVFCLPRKVARLRVRPTQRVRSKTRKIAACEQVDSVPVKCIKVDHEDGLFCVGRSYLTTHNTALSSATALYMLCADNEHGAEVYCGATSHAQALEVFKPAQEMCRRTPNLLAHYGVKVNANNIHILLKASKFEPIIGKPKDGASPSCAVIDEYHEHPTSVVYDTMKTGMGARQQPLILAITTAGDNLAGPCYDMVLTGRQLLEGTIEDETRFYIEYTIDETDDWADPNVLAKANPNLEVSVFKEFLLQAQKEAISNPRKAGVFRTKHLNQWIASKNAYFNSFAWNEGCDRELSEDSAYLLDSPCVIGLDLAAKVDIAALVLLFVLPDGKYATLSRFYLPEAIADEPGNQHYRAWADQGELILTPGNMIDHQWIKDDIDELCDKFDVQKVVFDPSGAAWMMATLMADGKPVIEFPQTAMNYSEPMRTLAGLIEGRKVKHNSIPNGCMSWQMSNVVSKTNRKDQDFPDKERVEKKIDGPVALIMAMSQLLVIEDTTSIYETQTPAFF